MDVSKCVGVNNGSARSANGFKGWHFYEEMV